MILLLMHDLAVYAEGLLTPNSFFCLYFIHSLISPFSINPNLLLCVQWISNDLTEIENFPLLILDCNAQSCFGWFLTFVVKWACKNIGTWNMLHKNLFLRRPCIKYCCHVWACIPKGNLSMLDEPQNWAYGTVATAFNVSLEPMIHCHIVTNTCIFYRHYLGKYVMNMLNWFLLVILVESLLVF